MDNVLNRFGLSKERMEQMSVGLKRFYWSCYIVDIDRLLAKLNHN